METQTRGKGTIDCRLQGSVGTLADANPTRLSKRSQAVLLQEVWNRKRVVYYAILLIMILGELLGEINYIIIRFPEYDNIPPFKVEPLKLLCISNLIIT